MTNNEEKRASALEIYQSGYQSIFGSGSKIDSKSFFIELRDAVIYEIETTGYCELVNKILEQGTGGLDIVACAALADIKKGFEDNMLTDVEKDPKYKEYVPHLRVRLRWSKCEFGRMNVSIQQVYEDVKGAREILQLHHIHTIKMERKTSINTDKKNIEVVERANEQAEKIISNAEVEAKRITNDANAEAIRIIEEAKVRAKEIDDSVTKEASEKAKDKAEKLVSRYLTEEQKSYKLELNDEMRKFTDAYIENSNRAMTVHTEMCDATNAVQARWIQALDDTISKMSDVKSEFYSHLHDWQVSLFPKEIKPLAERFLELYRIINVDKMLREEILLKSLSDEMSDDLTDSRVDKNNDLEIRIAGLQKLNKTLTTFLRRFELSLNGLDLYVFYPNPGDEFDETWHILDDEDEEYEGKYIKECIVPGIAKKANDDYGDDVLIPAVVKVETEN
ncbi:Uncharacterised protein [Roseburia hominis]|uniref:hypothetical protein n=1 Tax=Catenibacterium mitsuokai TaxID=100886 RepID=UPI0006C472B9|nr:hypothetical protein [Catenibacterium mitsuokai]CUO81321.1 Uncharacterised protein [Catenibacterium mitsuokai]CUO99333.1 Uncharacterised protein [Roseburia hominis]